MNTNVDLDVVSPSWTFVCIPTGSNMAVQALEDGYTFAKHPLVCHTCREVVHSDGQHLGSQTIDTSSSVEEGVFPPHPFDDSAKDSRYRTLLCCVIIKYPTLGVSFLKHATEAVAKL